MLNILSEYIENAMQSAEIRQLDDRSFYGKIEGLKGAIVFRKSRSECRAELRSTLEGLILISLKLGSPLPEIHGINLNQDPQYEEHFNS